MREAAWLLSLLILFVLNSLQVVTKGFRGAGLVCYCIHALGFEFTHMIGAAGGHRGRCSCSPFQSAVSTLKCLRRGVVQQTFLRVS